MNICLKSIRSKLSTALAASFAAAMLFTATGHAAALPIKDISQSSDYAIEALTALSSQGVITGNTNGYFLPKSNVTRSELITLLVRALNIKTDHLPAVPTFQDVPVNHWAFPYVEAAYRSGLIKGNPNGKFGLNDQCTREQMAAIFVRSLGISDEQLLMNQNLDHMLALQDNQSISAWAQDYIEFALTSGLMQGTSKDKFTPGGSSTKEQAAVVIHRYMEKKEELETLTEQYTAPVKNSDLYQAMLQSSASYKGNIDLTSRITVGESQSQEQLVIGMNMNGAINQSNSHIQGSMTMEFPGMEEIATQYESIILGSKLYTRMDGEETWSLMDLDEVAGGISGIQPTEMTPSYDILFRNFNNMEIQKTEGVLRNGETTTKYTLQLNSKQMQDLTASLMLADLGINEADTLQLTLDMSVYLNGQNQLCGEEIQISGSYVDAASSSTLTMQGQFDVSYTNIGADLLIQAPPANQVEEIVFE